MRGRGSRFWNEGEAAAAVAIKFVFCAIHCRDAPVVNFVSLNQISIGLTAQDMVMRVRDSIIDSACARLGLRVPAKWQVIPEYHGIS
jgi:hypothetical protein